MKKTIQGIWLILGFMAIAMPGQARTDEETAPPSVSGFVIDYHWQRENLCERGRSPQIVLQGVPEGTVKFKIRLKDLNMPSYNHGGGKIENDGTQIIQAGAIKNYRGPCPPMGLTHRYCFTIQALDAAGKTLAKADKIVPCNRAQMD